MKGHDQFIYDDDSCLLAMAMAGNALAGFNTLADLQEQKIPPKKDHVEIKFRQEVLDKPILRKCTMAGGVTEELMTRAAFSEILQATSVAAAFASNVTVHVIRRGLGKKVDTLYTEAQRSQHLTQADPRIFGTNYMANISSASGQDCFLGEPLDHHHVLFFQGLSQFVEPGLPTELPAQEEDKLRQDPSLRAIEAELQACSVADSDGRRRPEQTRRNCWNALKRRATKDYRDTWRRKRTEWYIATRGKEQPDDRDRTDLVGALCILIPERRRLAGRMKSREPLTPESMWLAIQDLYTLCRKDSSVLYLNGLQPAGGACPVKDCLKDLDR
ncbi:hypothetical protein GJ744_002202 [Endocarpon pusillum]|uniref:Uncharacterized protein n=1 Tax=Endocarpon pusillum TaxID=364733 RepID=A0A8H7A881_9EURO|nr:hypothetical protein GJ744_002202 [Endocarpon pusillum]